MSTIERRFEVADPLAYLPRLGELGFYVIAGRRREVERGEEGGVAVERFCTVLRCGGITASLEEYPFARFLRLVGEATVVRSMTRALGLRMADARIESVDAAFARWRAVRGLAPITGLRFADYNR